MFIILSLLYIAGSAGSLVAPLSPVLRLVTTTSNPSSPLPVCTCPNQRSVWNIVWNCFTTIFACSWVSVHPNIPAPGEKRWQIVRRRVEYMAWAILAPELVIFWAMRQYFAACKIAKRYRSRGCTMTFAHFLQMGGFMLFESGRPIGVLFYDKEDASGTFGALLNQKSINFPDITKEEIEDRSKSDGLSKCLVIGQTGWFVLQCTSRWATGHVITELELVTLALATLNAFMYFFWWHKPFDVRTQVPVYLLEPPHDRSEVTPEDQAEAPSRKLVCRISTAFLCWPKQAITDIFSKMGKMSFVNMAMLFLWMLITVFLEWPKIAIMSIFHRLIEAAEWGYHSDVKEGKMGVPMFYSSPALYHNDAPKIMGSAAALGFAFGAIHCVGWNFNFLTRRELVIWRVCSIIITVIPCQVFLYSRAWFQYIQTHSSNSALIFRITQSINVLTIPLYVVARLVLLLEALLTLANLPQAARTVLDWTSYLPHV